MPKILGQSSPDKIPLRRVGAAPHLLLPSTACSIYALRWTQFHVASPSFSPKLAGRLFPWQSWSEWQSTGEALLSGQAGAVASGLKQVALWRCRGRVPTAVESTAALVEAGCLEKAGWASEAALRALYSIALLRLVNGVVDPAQQGRFAASVAILAERSGLPRLLVDIRHEATHDELPGLDILRLAAAAAIEWLRRAYWERQRAHLATRQAALQATLQRYAAAVTGEVEGGEPVAPVGQRHACRDALAQLTELVAPAAAHLLVPPLLATPPAPRVLDRLPQRWPHLPALLLAASALALVEPGLLDGTRRGALRDLTTQILQRHARTPRLPVFFCRALLERCMREPLIADAAEMQMLTDLAAATDVSGDAARRVALLSHAASGTSLSKQERLVATDRDQPARLGGTSAAWSLCDSWLPCAVGAPVALAPGIPLAATKPAAVGSMAQVHAGIDLDAPQGIKRVRAETPMGVAFTVSLL